MFSQQSAITEFLAECNLALTQGDSGLGFEDVLVPIRNLLSAEQDLISYSLCRYAGANSQLAFFAEWFYQVYKLGLDSRPLLEENRTYFRKIVPLKLKGVPNLYELIDQDIVERFLSRQISFMQNKLYEFTWDYVRKYPYLSKYLNPSYLNKLTAGDVSTHKYLYRESMHTSEYVKSQSYRSSAVMITFPCLLGFTFNFNQEGSYINAKGIKWVVLEEILDAVAMLHQTAATPDLRVFLYYSSLDDKEQFNWLQLSDEKKLVLTLSSQENKQTHKELRNRVWEQAKHSLETLYFPDKYKSMLQDLLTWAYSYTPPIDR